MFTVVQLDFEMSDVRSVKITRTLFQILKHYVYSLLRRFIRYQKKVQDCFVLYDNGMLIGDSFIPYEYLVRVSEKDMVVLATYEEKRLTPGDNLVHITFTDKIDPMIVKNNLYYHLKYNDVSLDVLKFKSIKCRI
jgi:hypothetical protein